VWCDDWYIAGGPDVYRYEVYYGDFCGFQWEWMDCVECPDPSDTTGGGGGDEDCSYGHQTLLRPGGFDPCVDLQCTHSGNGFTEVMALVEDRDVSGLRDVIDRSDGKIYYSGLRHAIQMIDCAGIGVGASYPVDSAFASSLEAAMAKYRRASETTRHRAQRAD
jgi:hypothetical protein